MLIRVQAEDFDLGAVLDEMRAGRHAAIIHRFGALKPGDQIMMVAAASAHRAAAFEAADFMMDYLKSRAPFWKQEKTADNTAWVDAKEADDTARDRWEK